LTENLEKRIWEHKEKLIENNFTDRYNVTNLVYFEKFAELYEARDREYQIKKWTRKKKNFLIEKVNPTYIDLAKDWFEE
jgi:putative endonuclease